MTSIEFIEKNLTLNISVYDWLLLIEKAKEMHKQEIILFAEEYDEYVFRGGSATMEEYYNETFKKELTSQLPGINVNDVKPSNPQMIKENFSPKQK